MTHAETQTQDAVPSARVKSDCRLGFYDLTFVRCDVVQPSTFPSALCYGSTRSILAANLFQRNSAL